MYKRKSSPTSFSHADRLCDQMRVEQQQSNLLAAKLFLETSLNTELCEDLHKELQDGVILCRLINCIKPGTISSIGRKNIPFVKMANISLFLQGAKDLGLQNSDLFQTVDLYEAKDMAAVINTILTFARICNKDPKSTGSVGDNQKQNTRRPSAISHQRQQQQQQAQQQHRHVKNIFEHQLLSPDLNSCPQPLSSRDSNITVGMDTKLKGLRRAPKYLTQKLTLATEKQVPVTNDSGYGSLSRQRQISNSTSTQIMDALYDDENEGNDNGIHEGTADQQQIASHLQVHGGPCIVRKRFSQTSLNMESPQRPTLPTKIDSESIIDNPPALPPYPVPSQSTPPVSRHTLSASPLPLLPKKKKESLSAAAATNTLSFFGRTSSSSCPRKQNRTVDSNEKQSRRISSPTIGAITSNSVGIKDQRRLTVRISLKKRGNPTKRSTHFLLGDCVGKGQFGSVYRALDMQTGEIVAVKRISVEDTKVEDDIMQEINLLRGMACPHIVRYIGFAQDDTYMNIVLEYVENGSLLSTLKAFGSLPEKLVASYTYKILKGLEYLHNHDVVHCDLKAANILTTKTGDIKLTDFGVSLNLKIKQENGTGTPAGTPNWMAPEVIEMKGACYKSDIWSLACTITELLTGKPPYADLISMSALYHIVEDACPPLPENISDNLRDFLLLCFRKDPVHRPTASELLHHPWLQTINYDTTQSASPTDQQPCLDNIDEKFSAAVNGDVNLDNDSLETTVGRLIDQQQLGKNSMEEVYVDGDTEVESDDDTNSQVTILTCNGDFMDLIGKPRQHVFTKTRLQNHTVCEVCRQNSLYYAYVCDACAFVCHEVCRPKAALCYYSREKKNMKPHKVSQNDEDRVPPWISTVSPFGVTTFEPTMPSHALVSTRPGFPKYSSSNNSSKLQRFFGFRRKPQQQETSTDKPVYGILKAAKSVPLLRESQRKMLDEHSQLNYCDDNDIAYPLNSTAMPSSLASPPQPTNLIYRKKRRQASSSPTPQAAWKIAPASLNNMEQRQKRRTKSLQADKDCIIS